jgi:hypothetical protein
MQLTKVTLVNCFGFSGPYEVSLDSFTALVGPNNGGKTTLLQAINLATASLRLSFGEGDEPNYSNISSPFWLINPSAPGKRIGIDDFNMVYYGRSSIKPSKIDLLYQTSNGNLELSTRLNDAAHGPKSVPKLPIRQESDPSAPSSAHEPTMLQETCAWSCFSKGGRLLS